MITEQIGRHEVLLPINHNLTKFVVFKAYLNQSTRNSEIFLLVQRARDGTYCPIGTLRNYDGDGNEKVKKAIGLMCKTTTLHVHHAFLYISLQSLHNYDVK